MNVSIIEFCQGSFTVGRYTIKKSAYIATDVSGYNI